MTEKKLPISFVVITYNEETNIGRCLDAADFCVEIIVVDSGSSDKTVEIALQKEARVLSRTWTGYRDQKNYGTEQACMDWVLCIDADEVVSAELKQSIINNFQSEPSYDAFEITRHSYYGDKLINHCGWYPEWRLFLYRKGKAIWGGKEPHTTVICESKNIKKLDGDLYHYTYANIRQHIQKNIAAAYDSAVALYENSGKPTLFNLILHPPWAFVRSYFFRLGFLDGFYGFVICLGMGFYTFLKYAMLKEMYLKRSTRNKTL